MDLLRWAGDEHDVYWLGDAFQIERFTRQADEDYQWELVGEIDLNSIQEKDWRDKLVEVLPSSNARGRGRPGGPESC